MTTIRTIAISARYVVTLDQMDLATEMLRVKWFAPASNVASSDDAVTVTVWSPSPMEKLIFTVF